MALDHGLGDVVLQTMAFTLVGDLLLLCHTSAAPFDDEWDKWTERCTRGSEYRGMLGVTAGGSPNSRQRLRTADAMRKIERSQPPMVLLTDSGVIRSVVTAFSWILGKKQPLRALAPSELEKGLQWLKVTAAPEEVRAAITRLNSALNRAPTVRAAR